MNRHILKKGFLIIEVLCFAAFLILDFTGLLPAWNPIVKFLAICVCFIMSILMQSVKGSSSERVYVSTIMACTVLADVFLLLTNEYVIGIIIFLLVQNLYLYWLCRLAARLPKKGELEDRSGRYYRPFLHSLRLFGTRLAMSFILYLIVILSPLEEEIYYLLVIFYAVSFLDNVRLAVNLFITRRYTKYGIQLGKLTIGLLLFLCCDICVALFNMSKLFGVPFYTNTSAFWIVSIGMWFFYLPSQVLIVLSPED